MMPNPATDVKSRPRSPIWSNRILVATIAGILFLTLYPFRFSAHAQVPLSFSRFFLGKGLKRATPLNFALNVLLFIPFGFGLSSKLRQRNWSRAGSIVVATVVGGFFSYAVEFAQNYVPLRDSGWEDILANATGSVLGALVFAVVGSSILRPLSEMEESLESWLSAGRVWLLLLAYFGGLFVVSVPLQRQTSLKNWEPNSFLLVGNDGSLESPWKGRVFRLQIWDRAFPDRLAQEMTSRRLASSSDPTPLADYDLSLPPPIPDQQRFLPDLSWTSRWPPGKGIGSPEQGGNSWLVSQGAVTRLISALQKTNQFTIRIVCQPSKTAGLEGAIASIAQLAGKTNLGVWQQDTNLAFWSRNLVTINSWRTWHLRWSVPKLFLSDQIRDILICYDGSRLSTYVDGKRDPLSIQLGPGVSLANLFHRAQAGEVPIYNDLYYLVVFFPVGCLLGIGARKIMVRQIVGPLLVGFLLAPLALEKILVYVSGRSYSYSDLALSSALVAVATLWMNADRLYDGN